MRRWNWSLGVEVEPIVINTGPLILLEKAGALDLVGDLGMEFICPPAVRSELDVGATKGYAPIIQPWLTVLPLSEPLS